MEPTKTSKLSHRDGKEAVLDKNSQLVKPQDTDGDVEIDCTKCPVYPDKCDHKCVKRLGVDYFKNLISDSEEEADTTVTENRPLTKQEPLLEKIKGKVLLTEETTKEKIDKNFSEEDALFLKKEMMWNSIFMVASFAVGMILLLVLMKFNLYSIKPLFALSILILFSSCITNNFCRGKCWAYYKSGLRDKKHPVSVEQMVKDIHLLKDNLMTFPVNKKQLLLFAAIFMFGIVYCIS